MGRGFRYFAGFSPGFFGGNVCFLGDYSLSVNAYKVLSHTMSLGSNSDGFCLMVAVFIFFFHSLMTCGTRLLLAPTICYTI